ncbi:MAG: hypothetical protein QGH93_08535 [Gammaproteobacteria bacterium]|nr:hypothetical protein [Gammaproteobacteria bacterium]
MALLVIGQRFQIGTLPVENGKVGFGCVMLVRLPLANALGKYLFVSNAIEDRKS